MVRNRVPASGKQSRGLSGQAKCPPLHSSCVWDAGRSPTHSPHHPPPALWPCLGDLHELSFPAALRRSQPGQRLSLPSHCLAVPREVGLQRGWGSLPATRPLVLSPNSGAPGVCCKGLGWDRWCRAGAHWSGCPCCCSLVELPLTSGRRLPCLHGDQTVSAAPG